MYHLPTFSKIITFLTVCTSFPCSSIGKESAYNAGDPGLVPGLGRFPGEGNGYPLQYSCLGNLMDTRSLAGYSPWGCKELDKTEQLCTHDNDSQSNNNKTS